MKFIRPHTLILAMIVTLLGTSTFARAEEFYRLYRGITAYINNPEGQPFTVKLDLRDLNLYADGPREVLVKVYDPDGKVVHRQFIEDDGCASKNYQEPIGGWDHELQYYANLYAKGTTPSYTWSAWSDPNRLKTLVARTFEYPCPSGKKGVYRVMIAGTPDHYVTLGLDKPLKYGVSGHTTWMHGHGDLLRKRYIYVPKDTNGLFLALAEPDLPRQRHFKLTGPDGEVLLDHTATGGYFNPSGNQWQQATVGFAKAGQYDGKLLTLEVSPGKNDYLLKITFQQPRKGVFKDYVGMGSQAVYCPDPATANAIQGGTFVEDDQVFWHPFQARFHRWLKAHPLPENATDDQKALREQIETIYNGMRLIETGDCRGSRSWTNLAYAFGYYGCRIWRPAWVVMQRKDIPKELRDIIMEGLIMGGDRLSVATGIERVNGNAFSQINVALWYCHKATGDAIQKQRFEIFWDRWKNGGWGIGAGLSPSGDSQEHFAHDMHYGSYLMDNWRGKKWNRPQGGTWVNPSILDDTDDPRFEQVYRRYQELYSYLYCHDGDRPIAANPWSGRTKQWSHAQESNIVVNGVKLKSDPGPDFTINVNDGSEWFAARRKNYYMLTFHGRMTPEWMSRSFSGQLGFSGGLICQLTIPGKGPVLTSTLADEYGVGMDPSNWRNFHIHSLSGDRWDRAPVVASISQHDNAKLTGNTVESSGEVRNAHVQVSRKYTYNPDSIDCEVALAESSYAQVLSIWSHDRQWSQMGTAYEMIPYLAGDTTTVTLIGADGKNLGEAKKDNPIEAAKIKIDRGGFGVVIELDQPRKVQLGNDTVMIELVNSPDNPVKADTVKLAYTLHPYGN